MWASIATFWQFFGTLFTACNRVAATLDNVAAVGESASKNFLTEEQLRSEAKQEALKKQLAEMQATFKSKQD